jgi:hypothetical protein
MNLVIWPTDGLAKYGEAIVFVECDCCRRVRTFIAITSRRCSHESHGTIRNLHVRWFTPVVSLVSLMWVKSWVNKWNKDDNTQDVVPSL